MPFGDIFTWIDLLWIRYIENITKHKHKNQKYETTNNNITSEISKQLQIINQLTHLYSLTLRCISENK